MSKAVDVKEDKTPYQISTVNPETGQSDDLIATARAATMLLHSKGTINASGQCFAFVSPDRVLKEAGFTCGIAHFILFLDRMGLARKLTRTGSAGLYCYQIMDPVFFDVLVSPESVMAVLRQMQERRYLQMAVLRLKRILNQKSVHLRTSLSPGAEVTTAPQIVERVVETGVSLEQLAEAVARVEDLKAQNEVMAAEVAKVHADKQRLEEEVVKLKVKSDAAAIAAAMIAQMRMNKV